MINVNFDFQKSFFIKCGDEWPEFLSEILMKIALQAEGQVSKEAPVNTGTLRRSHNVSDDGKFTKSIVSNVNYWQYVVYGTQKHTITPKSKKALSWKDAEHPMIKVEHPGSKPNNYPQRALNKMQSRGDVDKITNEILRREGVIE